MAIPFEWRHPELKDGEVLLGNFGEEGFAECAWRTKRRGQVPYTLNNVPISNLPVPFFPVFVKRDELVREGIECEGQYTVLLH